MKHNAEKGKVRASRRSERYMRYGATVLSALTLSAAGTLIGGCGGGSSSGRQTRSTSSAPKSAETHAASSPKPTTSSAPKPQQASVGGNSTPNLHFVHRTLRTVDSLCTLIPTTDIPLEPGETIDGCGNSVATQDALLADYDLSDKTDGGHIVIMKDPDHKIWKQQSESLGNAAVGTVVGPTVDGSSTLYDAAGLATSTGEYVVQVRFEPPSASNAEREALDARILHNVFNDVFATTG